MSKLFPTTLPTADADAFPAADGSLTGHKKTEARLAAIESCYQHLLLGTPWTELAEQVASKFKARDIQKSLYMALNEALSTHFERYTHMAAAHQLENWPWARLPLTTQALLLTAIAELETQPTTDTPVVISQYIMLSQGFCSDDEVKFVNAILDKLAKQIRS